MPQASNAAMKGKFGVVKKVVSSVATAFPHVTNWKLKRANDVQKYVSSDTDGANRREPGVDDFTGSLAMKIQKDQPVPPLNQGDVLDVRLYRDKNVEGYWEGVIIVESVDEETDIEGGKISAYEVSFGADGRLVWVPAA